MNQDDKAFEQFARQQLEHHADAIDDMTAARLETARRHALEQTPTHMGPWIPLAAAASVLVMVFAFTLWQGGTLSKGHPPFEEWDIMADSGDLELAEDLEFYQWLDSIEQESLSGPQISPS